VYKSAKSGMFAANPAIFFTYVLQICSVFSTFS